MNDVVLITGPTSGIGLEFAHVFAREKNNLFLVGRDAKKLRALKDELTSKYHVEVEFLNLDLSEKESVSKILRFISKNKLSVHTLVNNAGFAVYGKFSQTPWEQEEAMLRVNMLTLADLTKHILPSMLARNEGKILNVASTAAFQPGPLMALYYASKSFVLSFSEALAEELVDTGVSVTCLCPGPTATHFQDRAKMQHSKVIADGRLMPAREVAEQAYHALQNKQRVFIPGLRNQVGAFAVRFAPRDIVTKLVKQIQESKKEK